MTKALSKLKHVWDLMSRHNLCAYIVPSEDAHQSEYVSEHDNRRAYISGFDGSAGTALVVRNGIHFDSEQYRNKNFLWTDGRYFLQAEMQLDKDHWKLMKSGVDVTMKEFIQQNKDLKRVGFDPLLFSLDEYRSLREQLTKNKKTSTELVSVKENLIDQVWEDQPKLPNNRVFTLGEEFCGKSTTHKLDSIRAELSKNKASHVILTALDEIAWTFNLRGSDVELNPVFFSYALISQNDATLYVNNSRFDQNVASHLSTSKVTVKPYDSFITDISQQSFDKVWIDPISCNMAVYQNIKSGQILEDDSPVKIAKSIKNETELQGFRDCHLRDGVALVKLFSWIEQNIDKGIDEVQVAEQALLLRSQQSNFVSCSFNTIAGSGPNGAIIHYHAQKSTCSKLSRDQVFLLDSGAQYLDGTTDVTRTLHYGQPTPHEMECFTRVLKGHISLDTLIFPHGVTGYRLDIVARMSLWRAGLDYNHGTGHGVGHFLNVHEGPHGIGVRMIKNNKFPLLAGMTVTNEPGYYENGKFGIRIENIMFVKNSQVDKFYCFENITVSPIQPKFVVKDLLSGDEIKWLNDYNAMVREKLTPLLADDSKAVEWLNDNTQPL
ncbi:Xaa-Pro aminopeptidase P [Acrasis kona]|uniref:Xaa-Pro aminopeptidase P n=1 Tax=Acrasis kona TaxID=1008807 RepID=A0AAW2ZGE3_9EUKA